MVDEAKKLGDVEGGRVRAWVIAAACNGAYAKATSFSLNQERSRDKG
ncbi:MAG: hypothetical protein ABFC77_14575 [Thermoguttaceae bacterium]